MGPPQTLGAHTSSPSKASSLYFCVHNSSKRCAMFLVSMHTHFTILSVTSVFFALTLLLLLWTMFHCGSYCHLIIFSLKLLKERPQFCRLYTCRRRISDLPVKCIYDLEYHIIFSGNTCLCLSGTVPSNLRKSSYIFFFWLNSSLEKREPTRSFVKDLQGCFSSEKFCGMSRRRLITEIIALSSAIIHVSPAISLPLQEAKDHEVIR